MMRLPLSFMPSPDPRPRRAHGIWFVFRQRELLVGEDFLPPRGDSLEPLGLRPLRVQWLGELGGLGCCAAELPVDAEPPPGMQFRDLRALFGRMPEEMLGLAGHAIQIKEWDRTHQFCGACGAPTDYHPTQRARKCTAPGCGLEFYPRLAPAMIVAVERGPEILLARSPHFPPGIYSVVAGFVEPGESAEGAVYREVLEETGIRVKNVRYFGSQPWPFPNSLMLGFQAEYDSGEVVPQAGEIEDAAFFHIDALPKTFPGRVSISQWLLHDFMRRHGREP